LASSSRYMLLHDGRSGLNAGQSLKSVAETTLESVDAMRKVRYEEMLPQEMEAAVAEMPVIYLPFGTLEWHGLHLALGNDAVKAYELCLRAAERSGGVVAPATYWAIGGMPHPWTSRIDPAVAEKLFYAIYEQMSHIGFKVIIAVTGHYGLDQYYTLKKAAAEFMYKSGVTIFPGPEYEVVTEMGYRGDHAAKWETSILWALRPELVDMGRLSRDMKEPLEGVGGEDPRIHASRELGEQVVAAMVERLAELAKRLVGITPLERSKHLEVLSRQVRILGRMSELARERRPLFTEEYYRFLDHFWRGRYAEARSIADEMLSTLP